jgi:choline dehydrogenase-like flavoprotein
MNRDKVDVLIIGAGASGAAAAWNLSDTGLSIVCLEQGERIKPESYPSTRVDWEMSKYGKSHVSPNVRKLKADYPINDSASPIAIANYNAVGGSTILYSGHFPRFHPSDFKVKTLDGIADNWPIDYSDLEPYFSLNDKMMGVSGLMDDPAYPPINNLLPPVALGKMGKKIVSGFNKKGWHIWPSYSAIITREYRHREKCINLGPCNTGCPQGAKGSVDVTYWPLALQNGVELRTHSRVKEVTVNEQGLADGAIYYDKEGNECFQSAKLVIVACNGVGTPRLLLNSKSNRFPYGIANSSGLVGKNLMLHPLGYVEGVFNENLDSHIGPQGSVLYSHEFYETDESRDFKRGFTMQILRGPGPLETALSGIMRRQIPTGKGHHEAFASHFGKTIGMGIIVEDLPEEENRVTLDPELKDGNGIPAPKIDYRLGENSKKMLTFGLKKGKEVMAAAGAKSTIAFGPVRHTGWHLMGTTKMGNNPNKSVVNKYGQTHDVKNLFIVDSSIFVTSAGVNPASTLQALALYITNNIKLHKTNIL